MKCVVCGGDLEEKRINLPFEYKGCLVLIKNVNAHVCKQCAEAYLPPKSDGLVKNLTDRIDKNRARLQEVKAVVETAA
jgi:YgiT-type zinc finger domain-containing protein